VEALRLQVLYTPSGSEQSYRCAIVAPTNDLLKQGSETCVAGAVPMASGPAVPQCNGRVGGAEVTYG